MVYSILLPVESFCTQSTIKIFNVGLRRGQVGVEIQYRESNAFIKFDHCKRAVTYLLIRFVPKP